ncbi:MAG: hypothetical protein WA364_23040 [Candidatus Nitrosopolaris sp.]
MGSKIKKGENTRLWNDVNWTPGHYIYAMKAPLTRQKYKARFAKFLTFVDRGDGGNSLEERARAFAASAEKANVIPIGRSQTY